GVIWWADDAHGTAVARTMGMTTFAIANVYFSFCVKDELRSIFSLDTFADRRLLKATGLSVVAIVVGTELQIFQRIPGTVSLTGREWIVCILAAGMIVVAWELQKLVRRRGTAARPDRSASESVRSSAPASWSRSSTCRRGGAPSRSWRAASRAASCYSTRPRSAHTVARS